MQLIKTTLNDLKDLQYICIEAYSKNFKNHWTKNGLELYLESQFNIPRLISDIKDPNIDYFFISFNNKNVGFLKLKTLTNIFEEGNCELEKIYILPKYKGKGFGRFSLISIIKNMRLLDKKSISLDVIDTNTNAISFYKSLGFKKTGTTTLDAPFFKEELKGMYLMKLELS